MPHKMLNNYTININKITNVVPGRRTTIVILFAFYVILLCKNELIVL